MQKGRVSIYFVLLVATWILALVAFVLANFTQHSTYDLGCPYWPGCPDKEIDPTAAKGVLRSAVGALTTYSTEFMKRWNIIQYSFDGALALMLGMVMFYGKRQKDIIFARHWRKYWALATIFFVLFMIGQTATAKWSGSFIGLLQILSGVSILALLWWALLREHIFWRPLPAHASRGLRLWILASLLLVILQISLGAWVTVNRAGLACPDIPTCQLEWWPKVDFAAGFDLWTIGRGGFGQLDLAASTAIQMVHRIGAVVTGLCVGTLAVYVLRRCEPEGFCRYGLILASTLTLIVTVAVIQVVMHLPSVLVVTHGVLAILLLLSVITMWHVATPKEQKD